jgi:iron complex outermembrane recepter protein
VELAGFYFKLEDALVVRKDSSNADFFVNAGDTRQKGIELGIDYSVVSFNSNSIFESFIIRTAQSFNEFKYGEFKKGIDDFSDKFLPGVPNYTASAIADLVFKKGAYINLNFYHATSIFLNDANSAEASPYTIVGARAGWRFKVGSKVQLNIYVGGDNLLDETYSLGNDINAAGGRYYNTAFGKNYYVGIAFKL